MVKIENIKKERINPLKLIVDKEIEVLVSSTIKVIMKKEK